MDGRGYKHDHIGLREYLRAICKLRGLDPHKENINTILAVVHADKTLNSFIDWCTEWRKLS